MKIDHLLSFRKVATTGSFTRAAQEMFITQPTVTHHIQMLEHELGYELFVRS
ncbi:MAG: LysR family transcriptional regulator, partial [Mailhella sp.]|nr:LysR family transcriptional regulator [Mailhella sp.]